MAVQRVTLTVGDTAYDIGTVDALGTDDERWAELERFLRAVADTLKDGYTLRRKTPASRGCACPSGCEGGPECMDDEGGPIPKEVRCRARN